MAKIPVLDAVRIIPRDSDFLNRKSGSRGEIFFDRTSNTLRIYDGNTLGGINLAKSDLTNVSNTAFLAKAAAAGVGSSESGASISVSATAPQDAASGNLWFNSVNGYLYVYVDDGSSEQWVQPGLPIVNLAGYATETYVGTAISNLIDTAPTTLNTLNELAAALGDDANYASTITTALGLKAPLADPTFTGTVSGITKAMVGLGNVTNESKATMFNNPTFTGTVTGVTATIPNGATLNTPLINGGVLNGGGVGNLTLRGNVLTEDSTITIASDEFYSPGYFLYNSFQDAILLTILPPSGKPLIAIQTLQPGDVVLITLSGTPTQYIVEEIFDLGINVGSTEHIIRFVDDTGLPEEFADLEAITVPLRPGIWGSQEFIVNSTLTTRRASEFITVYGNGLIEYDYFQSAVWYFDASAISTDFSVPITSVPFNNNRVVVMTLIVAQGATGYIPSSVSVNGFSTTVQWLGGVAPVGTANATDVFSFSLLRINNANVWTVLGSVSSFKSIA
jgi:hypothetical protein